MNNWTPLAQELAKSRYFRPGDKNIHGLVNRVVKFVRSCARKQKYFSSSKLLEAYSKELHQLLTHQKVAFNTPVWLNAGTTKNTAPQLAACFIQSLEDSEESVFHLAHCEASIFGRGSGSGTNFSKIRSSQESSFWGGLIPLLEIFDKIAGAISSAGKKRRAAKMVCLDIDHPDVMKLILWKRREEEKAKVLFEAGYGNDFLSESYKTVSGQNANVSIRITDSFMKNLERNGFFFLRSRSTGQRVQRIRCHEMWEELAHSAWSCGDPGVQFSDTINKWNTCSASGTINGSNPCSEVLFLDNTACNLASLNLIHFLDGNQEFQIEDFLRAIEALYIAQDLFIDAGFYPSSEIKKNSLDYRPIGIGIAGWGAFLMRKGIPYSSEEARNWGRFLCALLTGQAYKVSGEWAVHKGPFRKYRKNKKSMRSVIDRHIKNLITINFHSKDFHSNNLNAELPIKHSLLPEEYRDRMMDIWLKVQNFSRSTGFRNAQVSALAPTGTSGIFMDAETYGIEPEFGLIHSKKWLEGKKFIAHSASLEIGLKQLGYSERDRKKIVDYVKKKGSIIGAPLNKKQHENVFHTALEISPLDHLKMVAALQPYISGGISKTIQLANSTGVGEVKSLFHQAWKSGLKAISIYRDGSKLSQPLNKSCSMVPSEEDKLSGLHNECG